MSEKREASPVSFPVNVHRLPRTGLPVAIEAGPDERAALAAAHGLLSVERFHADLTVRPWKGDGVRIVGTVRADITQACVVTLEPVAAHLREAVAATLVPVGSRLARDDAEGGEFVLDAEGPDLPETFTGDTIDAGALAEEFFTLAIDPYPRRPDAAVATEPPAEQEERRTGPLYEGLRKLGQKS